MNEFKLMFKVYTFICLFIIFSIVLFAILKANEPLKFSYEVLILVFINWLASSAFIYEDQVTYGYDSRPFSGQLTDYIILVIILIFWLPTTWMVFDEFIGKW